jgi:hypothetical protein
MRWLFVIVVAALVFLAVAVCLATDRVPTNTRNIRDINHAFKIVDRNFVEGPLNNPDATTDPSGTRVGGTISDSDDDRNDGYGPLSFWLNNTSQEAFVCTNATVGAATWVSLSESGLGVTGNAWTIVTADSGTNGTADTATDTLAFLGGTALATVSANDTESITFNVVPGDIDLVDLGDWPLTTRGDLLYRNATVPARLAVGANTHALFSDGTDPGWRAITEADISDLSLALDDLNDVVITAVAGDHLLGYDVGGNWINQTAADLEIADSKLTYLTVTLHAGLTAERALTAGEGIDFVDGGAGSTFTVLGEPATDTNLGIATFDASDFTVVGGDVTLDTVAIGDGGTGQTTQQAAIDALTAVSGATNEHVLTKDTATGNAIFKAAAGGGDAFTTIDAPAGTDPVASGADTLILATANNRLAISGDSGTDTITYTLTEANIDHDALTNFVADEHVAHSGVTITAGDVLSGGGTIAASRTIDLDIDGLAADGSPDGAADYVVTLDATGPSYKKVLLDDLPGGGGGGNAWDTITTDSGTATADSAGDSISITGADFITVTATDGPETISIQPQNNPTIVGTEQMTIPTGTTGQRPGVPVVGMLRYNSTNSAFEGYEGASPAWVNFTYDDTYVVTATASIPDNELVRGDGGSRGVQGSSITVSDAEWVENVALIAGQATNDLNIYGGPDADAILYLLSTTNVSPTTDEVQVWAGGSEKITVDNTGMAVTGSITVTGTVDTVDIQDHSARHESGGADVLSLAASQIATGTLAHERGGLESDVSAVALGDIIAGSGAGSFNLVTSTGHSDGNVLTRQGDGSVDYEVIPDKYRRRTHYLEVENPTAGDEFTIAFVFEASTMKEVFGEVDTASGVVTFNVEERFSGCETAGTDTLTSDLAADDNRESSTTFTNSDIAADSCLTVTITSITATPTLFYAAVTYVED